MQPKKKSEVPIQNTSDKLNNKTILYRNSVCCDSIINYVVLYCFLMSSENFTNTVKKILLINPYVIHSEFDRQNALIQLAG